MKDADLKRNASGYYDETDDKAITAPPNAGEIWANKDGTKCWLILKNNGPACSTLLLGKEEKENSIKVMGRVPMYTNPVMIGYTFTVYISTFVKTIPADKLAEVQKAVGEALGITATAAVPHDHINALEAKNAELHDTVVSLQKWNKKLEATIDQATDDVVNFTDTIESLEKEIAKLNIYKDMYMDLIDKLVAVRGGAVND